MREVFDKTVAHLVELRHVYDGYSVTVYTDGTMVNRWDAYVEQYPDDQSLKRRQELTQQWLDNQVKEAEDGEVQQG